ARTTGASRKCPVACPTRPRAQTGFGEGYAEQERKEQRTERAQHAECASGPPRRPERTGASAVTLRRKFLKSRVRPERTGASAVTLRRRFLKSRDRKSVV